MPMTPTGHDSLYSINPSSNSVTASWRPIGSASAATCRTPAAICAIPRSLRCRRSNNARDICPFSTARIASSQSRLLALRISSLRCSIALAAASKAASRTSQGAVANKRDAALARRATSPTSDLLTDSATRLISVLTPPYCRELPAHGCALRPGLTLSFLQSMLLPLHLHN